MLLHVFDFHPLSITANEEEIPSESSLLPENKVKVSFSLSASLNSHVGYPRQFSPVSPSPSPAAICSDLCVSSAAANVLHSTVLCFQASNACLFAMLT